MKKKEKILVAMSGGVDSSVVAALLVEAGYDVTGAFMVNYDDNGCWHGDYQDALRVAAKLNIPLLRLDFQKEYKEMVLDYMYKEYEKGRTPNPDVMCNKFVKFGVWLDKARELSFGKLATGHYGVIKRNKKQETNKYQLPITNYQLLKAKDKNKDQTYFLHQLTQEQLSYVLFPLGEYTKSEVRKLAKKFKLPTAEKEESMGICFVGEVNMKEFLETRITQKKGKIILSDGTVVGEHDGLAFYTIGQRHLSLQHKNTKTQKHTDSKPLYVVGKDFEKNQLIVGYEDDPLLFKKEIEVESIHWIGQEPKFPLKCKVRLRHRQDLQDAIIKKAKKQESKKAVTVEFVLLQRAVTPGQFAVFYKDNGCLGGGVVK